MSTALNLPRFPPAPLPAADHGARPAVPLRAGRLLTADEHAHVRQEMALRHCKWDQQVGDQCTLAPFPLLMAASEWRRLCHWSRLLTQELLAAEGEICRSPALQNLLGVPRRVRRLIKYGGTATRPESVRVIRFDFHFTTDGWKISEANTDVPGGYSEASALPALMQQFGYAGLPAGDPAGSLVNALLAAARRPRVVLLAAAGYLEDQQVVSYLAQRLAQRGAEARLCTINQLKFANNGIAILDDAGVWPADALIRFYQAEWLAGLPRRLRGKNFFRCPDSVLCNPFSAAASESKRFPLALAQLTANVPTWNLLLPESVNCRAANLGADGSWVLKLAYSNTGDAAAHPDWADARMWRKAVRAARRRPRQWVAQKRFITQTVATPLGPVYPCIGVFTINGVPAGIYGRISSGPLINYAALDVAVLIDSPPNLEGR